MSLNLGREGLIKKRRSVGKYFLKSDNVQDSKTMSIVRVRKIPEGSTSLLKKAWFYKPFLSHTIPKNLRKRKIAPYPS